MARGAAVVGSATLVVLTSGIAALFYHGREERASSADEATRAIWLGPPAQDLKSYADAHLRSAVGVLDDAALTPAERTTRYREELSVARNLLRRAVLADPSDAHGLMRLAAVLWEAGVLGGEPQETAVSVLIDVAAKRAPDVPEIQAQIGELSYKMGRFEDAGRFMAEAVRLSPTLTNRVVAAMLAAGLPPDRVLDELPEGPDVLIALRDPFVAAGRGREFLGVLEARLSADPVKLMIPLGELALSLDEAPRLRADLGALGRLPEPSAEGERLFQLARAALRTGDVETAYAESAEAFALSPDDPRHCDLLAESAIRAERLEEAERAVRDGLARQATDRGSDAWRSRFYRRLGEISERAGRGDDAVVQYQRAIALDPEEPVAKARLAAIRSLLKPAEETH